MPASRPLAGGRTAALAVCFLLAVALPPTQAADATPVQEPTLAQELLERYARIRTLSCEISKTTRADGRSTRLLSRVHYRAPESVHIENVSPARRTILSDGTVFHYHDERMPRGFSRPVAELSETWREPLRNIPGTATEHILRIGNATEIRLPPADGHPVVRAYDTGTRHVVLYADEDYRLHKIMFYDGPAREALLGEYRFSRFEEVLPGCWIPLRHEAIVHVPGEEPVLETRRISRVAVNAPMPDSLFDHRLYFRNIEFVDDFERTYR